MGGVCPLPCQRALPYIWIRALSSLTPCTRQRAPNNAVRLTLEELERVTGGTWVDVCKSGEA